MSTAGEWLGSWLGEWLGSLAGSGAISGSGSGSFPSLSGSGSAYTTPAQQPGTGAISSFGAARGWLPLTYGHGRGSLPSLSGSARASVGSSASGAGSFAPISGSGSAFFRHNDLSRLAEAYGVNNLPELLDLQDMIDIAELLRKAA